MIIPPNNMYGNLYNVGSARNYTSSIIKPTTAFRTTSRSTLINGLNSYYNPYGNLSESMADTTLKYASENAQRLSGLKNAAYGLSSAARYSDANTYYSSDDSVATISGSSFYGMEGTSYELNVSELAARQMSQSESFISADPSVFGEGENTLSIAAGEMSYDVSFEVIEGDTNLDALNNLAASVNSSDAPVTAKVISESGAASIRLSSLGTGAKGAFELVSNQGKDAAEKLEMREIQTARNASFRINGEEYTSSGNEVELMGGSLGTITLSGPGEAIISQGVDASEIVSSAAAFSKAYNEAISFIARNSTIPNNATRALGMLNGMGGLSDSTKARLAAMGIFINEDDGSIHMDHMKLLNAIQEGPDTVKETLAGSSIDAANSLEQGARDVMAAGSHASTYTSFGTLSTAPNVLNMLMPRTGFLFDLSL